MSISLAPQPSHPTEVTAPRGRVCPRCRAIPAGATTRCDVHDVSLVDDWSGAVLDGRYVVGRLLGASGLDGGVWEAVHRPLDRVVSLAIGPATGDARARFLRGAEILGQLAHPHVAALHDQGEHAGAPFIVTDRLRGAPLDHVLARRRLGTPRAVHVVSQLLEALDHVHERGFVHRDVCPASVFLGDRHRGFTVKLRGFDLARANDDATVDSGVDPTEERRIRGAPHYLAPEQIVGSRVDARADIYASGVLLFEMLAGVRPFDGQDRRAVYVAKLHDAPPPLASVARSLAGDADPASPNPARGPLALATHGHADSSAASPSSDPLSFDPDLEAVVRKAIRTLPCDRFDNAAAMLEALGPFRSP